MTAEHINLKYLSSVQRGIEGLTDIRISIYDRKGVEVLASRMKAPPVSLFTNTETGEDDYNNFRKDTIKTAVLRKDITISRSPAGHFHFFIPCHINDTTLVLVGGAFSISFSLDDFRDFISRPAHRYSDPTHLIEAFSDSKISMMDYEKVWEIALNIQKIFYSLLMNGYDSWMYKQKYSRLKTIQRLMSDMGKDISRDGIYKLLSDILLFLFNVDSLSFMTLDDNVYRTVFAAGRLKEEINSLTFKSSALISTGAVKERHPAFYDDLADIRELGLNEQFESIHLLPIFSEKIGFQLICIYNTKLTGEDEAELFDLCRLVNYLMSASSAQNDYKNKIHEVIVLNHAASGLNLMFDKPEVLYKSILDTAVELSKAGRGSLMLADNDKEELNIIAVHGINKWLVEKIKIVPGEGIAGKVFKEREPIISRDIEKDFSIRKKPVYRTASFISIPLLIGKELIGILNVSDKTTGDAFIDDDLAIIRNFANYASIAIKSLSYYNLAEYMKELSMTDHLTGLFNRRYFQDRLAEELDRSERHDLIFSLCIIDIDDFKLFNDTEGHPAGDELLKNLTQVINESLRATDVLARIGGEEFAVIMPQTDKDEAFFVAERIRTTVRENLDRSWNLYPKEDITISIGISSYPFDNNNPKKLIRNADKALYRAKMRGKNKTFVWAEQSVL